MSYNTRVVSMNPAYNSHLSFNESQKIYAHFYQLALRVLLLTNIYVINAMDQKRMSGE
jgi:hypothetical protein